LNRFVKLAVDELHKDLDPLEIILRSKIDRALGVFEIESLIGVGGPVPKALQKELGADML
jgi:hypothetical protein